MATIVKISTSNANGAQVLDAVGKIREGLAKLQQLNGLRANAIGASAAEMQTVFGISTEQEAQDLSNRWNALFDALYNASNPAYDEFAMIRDFIEGISFSAS